MKALILLTLLLASLNVLGDDSLLHPAAHIGMSYALTTFGYGLSKKALRCKDNDALILAGFTTLVIGLSYKYMGNANSASILKAMGYNAIGVAGSVFTIKVFDF